MSHKAPDISVLLLSLGLLSDRIRFGQCEKVLKEKLLLKAALMCFVDEASKLMWIFLVLIFALY